MNEEWKKIDGGLATKQRKMTISVRGTSEKQTNLNFKQQGLPYTSCRYNNTIFRLHFSRT